MNRGIFQEVDLGNPEMPDDKRRKVQDEQQGTTRPGNYRHDDIPYTFLEQHTYWDLDGDGYKEPYIITVELNSKKVVRVVANYHQDTVERATDGSIVAIKPVQYFTKYSFIPNPDGGFYDLGFGILLGPLNRTANTLINQLLDAGTLANMPSGFIARGIRFKGGKKSMSPGQWVTTLSTGDDLRKGIVPLPVKEPSNVLFQLLGLILDGGKRVSSVSDIMSGINPGQNQPATTSMAVLEQGLKVFSAIHKRMFRAEKREFLKLYELNRRYLDAQQYFNVLDAKADDPTKVFKTDYSENNFDVTPSADPKIMTEAQKLMRAQMLLQMKDAGLPLNTEEITKRLLEAQDQPDTAALLKPDPQSQPDPKIMLEAQKLQWDQQKFMRDYELRVEELKATINNKDAQAELYMSQAQGVKIEKTLQTMQQEIAQFSTWVQMMNGKMPPSQQEIHQQQQQAPTSPQGQGSGGPGTPAPSDTSAPSGTGVSNGGQTGNQ